MKFEVGDLVKSPRLIRDDAIGVVIWVDHVNAERDGVMNTQVCFPSREERRDHWYADDELTLVMGGRSLPGNDDR